MPARAGAIAGHTGATPNSELILAHMFGIATCMSGNEAGFSNSDPSLTLADTELDIGPPRAPEGADGTDIFPCTTLPPWSTGAATGDTT